jgi:hypothetical protein
LVLPGAILAADKFRGGVPLPTLWNLSTCWLAQWLIARAAAASPSDLSRTTGRRPKES